MGSPESVLNPEEAVANIKKYMNWLKKVIA
jgi:hypothetical protein